MANEIEKYFMEAREKIQAQNLSGAINSLLKVIAIDPNNKKAKTQISYLEEIIRFNNTDVFSSTNLFMDPWE